MPLSLPAPARTLAKYGLDVAVWTALTPVAFALRLEGDVFRYPAALVTLTLVGAVLKLVAVGALRLQQRAWRWVSVSDLLV